MIKSSFRMSWRAGQHRELYKLDSEFETLSCGCRDYSHLVSTPIFKQLHSQASAQQWKPWHQSRVQSMLRWEWGRQDCFTSIRSLWELGRAQCQLHRVTVTQEQESISIILYEEYFHERRKKAQEDDLKAQFYKHLILQNVKCKIISFFACSI